MAERTPETDVIARVLIGWMADHGYTLNEPSGNVLVSTDQIREDLVKIRSDNPPLGNTREGRRWNRAIDKMFRLIDYYERTSLDGLSKGEVSSDCEQYQELLGSIWLYVDWRWLTTQLTIEQKELWADAVDATGEPGEDGPKADRWWRDNG